MAKKQTRIFKGIIVIVFVVLAGALFSSSSAKTASASGGEERSESTAFLSSRLGHQAIIPTALAASEEEKCKTGFYEYAGVCYPEGTGLSEKTVKYILEQFGIWLFSILGIIGVIIFVICGAQYLMAAGEDERIQSAKRCMTFAILGIVIALGALVIIYAVDKFVGGTLGGAVTIQ